MHGEFPDRSALKRRDSRRPLGALIAGPVIAAMSAMAAMHEDVHERASEEQQPWQEGHDVGIVLLNQEAAGDRRKADENDVSARRTEAPLRSPFGRDGYGRVSCVPPYSTIRRPRNMPIGQAKAYSPGVFGISSTATSCPVGKSALFRNPRRRPCPSIEAVSSRRKLIRTGLPARTTMVSGV